MFILCRETFCESTLFHVGPYNNFTGHDFSSYWHEQEINYVMVKFEVACYAA